MYHLGLCSTSLHLIGYVFLLWSPSAAKRSGFLCEYNDKHLRCKRITFDQLLEHGGGPEVLWIHLVTPSLFPSFYVVGHFCLIGFLLVCWGFLVCVFVLVTFQSGGLIGWVWRW